MSTVVFDTRAVFAREMTLVMRDPFSLAFSIVQPLVFLALFGPLLGATVGSEAFGGESSLQWFLPGVIVMLSMFGTTMTGSNLQIEMNTGSSCLVTPFTVLTKFGIRSARRWSWAWIWPCAWFTCSSIV